MTPPSIIPVTATLETLLSECVGAAPELVKLNDWRTIALRLSRRLEESGLRITRHATKPEDRAQLVGQIKYGEIALVVADGPDHAIVLSSGPSLATLPAAVQEVVLRDMLTQAIGDLRQARAAKKDIPR